MEEPSVTKMIYTEVMIMRRKVDAIEADVASLREAQAVRDAKIFGGFMVVSVICTVVFQVFLAIIQKG